MHTGLLIGGVLCGIVFLGIIGMAAAAAYYGKKENKN